MVFDNGFMINKKGQLSIEFILILIIVILLLQIMILPMRNSTKTSLSEITHTAYLENDLTKIKNNVELLSTMSTGKLKTEIYLPEDTNLFFKDTNVIYEITFDENMSKNYDLKNCKNFVCRKSIDLNTSLNFNTIAKGKIEGPVRGYLVFTKNNNKNNNQIILNFEKLK